MESGDNMRQILSSKTRRQLELVELLFENEWITFVKASERLKVPTKTLKADINELDLLFNEIKIKISKKHGINLVVDSNFSRANIYQTFLKNSIEFQIIQNIFVNNYTCMLDLANELFISISTLKRIVSRINKVIQVEGFVVNLKKMRLAGDPLSICNFMHYYYKEKYVTADRLLTPLQLDILDQILIETLDEQFPETTPHVNFSFLNKLRLCSYVAILFLKHDKCGLLYNKQQHSFGIIANTNICDEFFRQFSVKLTNFTLSNIFHCFFDPSYIRSVENLNAVAKLNPQIQRQQHNILLFIQELEKKTNCTCTKSNDVLLHLYNLQNQIHGRTYIFYDTNKEFYLNLLHYYGSFISDMMQSLEAIFYKTPHKEYLLYQAFFILFTNWPDLLESLERSSYSIRAGMLYDVNKDYVEILAKKTEYYLNNRFVCTPLPVSSIAELETVAPLFDCIITNISDISVSDVPVIVTPLLFDVESFDKLTFFYENHFKK